MKVIVLDDIRKKTDSICSAFSKKKINAVVCTTSNEFMTAVTEEKFDAAYINVEIWNKGRSIYEYFDIVQRFGNKPIVFYNADETFTGISNRHPRDDDRIHHKPADIEEAIRAA